MSFEVRDRFYMDGEPFRIISGSIHYFRVVPEYWRDRLEKLKALGCNTVETYIPWNMHEPQKGKFRFDGMLDVERFVKLAQELGLYVILRPSPYICAEWELGGLPPWLLSEDGMRFRVYYPPYLKHVRDYYEALMKRLVPLQIDNGGPVIMMQVENEYGSYANDKQYIEWLRDLMRELGVTVPLCTSDGPTHDMLHGGTMDGVLATANFGSRAEEAFGYLAKFRPNTPLMCMEFWIGWFDAWGNVGHMKGDLEGASKDLDKLLELGNVNFYMFEGGTNFGFMNGANYYDRLTPDTTSYDYDAILTEDGQITEKYRRFRAVIGKYRDIPEVELTTEIKRMDYGVIPVSGRVGLFSVLDSLSSPIENTFPQPMEKLGQSYGYILYHTDLRTEEQLRRLRLHRANDRAQVFVDKKPVITLMDKELLEEHELDVSFERGANMDILVEDLGRVNFAFKLEEQRKGIEGGVWFNGHWHNGWKQYPLPLDDLSKLDFAKGYQEGLPAFYRFTFDIEETGDTFLDFEGWGKGVAFVNGVNLGRFWEIGPQKRLYIPGPLLKAGTNEIILFETEGKAGDSIALRGTPDIG
ncbi:MAG: beta-galactosidase [Acutalibacter sp.]|jgi:beta-galactosidase|uniref:glycoside hydrolase family 35 protein n=1 Tax=Acutalibacter sp. TaxID=1918636 RepID=UPI0021705740|nr:beta-galactosidase family protein [Acutalibacter sp.]MCI9225123.1 beta-galactosidase [Acutalibacter sp.]